MTHQTSLTRHFLIKWLYQDRKVSWHVFVWQGYLFFSSIFQLELRTVPPMSVYVFVLFCFLFWIFFLYIVLFCSFLYLFLFFVYGVCICVCLFLCFACSQLYGAISISGLHLQKKYVLTKSRFSRAFVQYSNFLGRSQLLRQKLRKQ